MDLPQPEITELNRPYWDGLREGRLRYQQCACGNAWLPARRECPACLGEDVHWRDASGRGSVLSWVVYHTAYHPAFEARLPYHVALVELDEGPRLLTRVLDGDARLAGGLRVALAISHEGGLALPTFRVADDDSPGQPGEVDAGAARSAR